MEDTSDTYDEPLYPTPSFEAYVVADDHVFFQVTLTPAGPCGPAGPVAPVGPVGPCGPVGPVAPTAAMRCQYVGEVSG